MKKRDEKWITQDTLLIEKRKREKDEMLQKKNKKKIWQ